MSLILEKTVLKSNCFLFFTMYLSNCSHGILFDDVEIAYYEVI